MLINEVVVDLPGADSPSEYFELIGTPGTTLTNVYFVAVRGDNNLQGQAHMVVPLGSAALGANGLLVIKAATGGYTIPAGTTVVTDAQLNPAGGASTRRNLAFRLVRRAPPRSPRATDYDANNDGTLERCRPAPGVLDAVGWSTAARPTASSARG